MIDWYRLAANGLWIAGLAVIVAAFSYHDWVARETKRPRRDLFRQRSWQLPWTTGMCLTCVGWGLSQASWWWETVLWLALGGWFAWTWFVSWPTSRHRRTQTNTVKSRPQTNTDQHS